MPFDQEITPGRLINLNKDITNTSLYYCLGALAERVLNLVNEMKLPITVFSPLGHQQIQSRLLNNLHNIKQFTQLKTVLPGGFGSFVLEIVALQRLK